MDLIILCKIWWPGRSIVCCWSKSIPRSDVRRESLRCDRSRVLSLSLIIINIKSGGQEGLLARHRPDPPRHITISRSPPPHPPHSSPLSHPLTSILKHRILSYCLENISFDRFSENLINLLPISSMDPQHFPNHKTLKCVTLKELDDCPDCKTGRPSGGPFFSPLNGREGKREGISCVSVSYYSHYSHTG